jgi:putative endonuclease
MQADSLPALPPDQLDRPDQVGRDSEAVAGRFLHRRGLRIVARNHQTGVGEIDLVATDGSVLVFVEVKGRTASEQGLPEDAITAAKRRKLTQCALAFIREYGQSDRPCRFDVVAVQWPDGLGDPEIRHYENAFPAAAGYEAY